MGLKVNSKNKQKRKVRINNQKNFFFIKKTTPKIWINNNINLIKKNIWKINNNSKIPLSFSKSFNHYIKYKILNPNNKPNLKEQIFTNKPNYNKVNTNPNNLSFNKKNKFQSKHFFNNKKIPSIRSINNNNYIINNFSLSSKNYTNNNTQTQKPSQKNLTGDVIKYSKEKLKLKEMNIKHQKMINKLNEDKKKLNEEINLIKKENSKLKQKIKNYKDNQEQLVMLIKVIQKSGVNIEDIIDRWNNENVEEEENDEQIEEINSKSLVLYSFNELNEKIDCSSFIPITVKEKKREKKIKVTGIPKLNFEVLKNKQKLKMNFTNKNQSKKRKNVKKE